MKKTYRTCFFWTGIFCLAFFLLERAAGQSYIHAIHHLSIENGLPHRVVYDVPQEDQGFIWLATEAPYTAEKEAVELAQVWMARLKQWQS